jgi:hypothetical protein
VAGINAKCVPQMVIWMKNTPIKRYTISIVVHFVEFNGNAGFLAVQIRIKVRLSCGIEWKHKHFQISKVSVVTEVFLVSSK